jgi:hypothetical protein
MFTEMNPPSPPLSIWHETYRKSPAFAPRL